MKASHELTPQKLGSASQDLLKQGRARRPRRMHDRERLVEIGLAASFLAAGVLLALLGGQGPFPWLDAVALLVAYAVLSRLEYDLGAGSMVPTQLVFVPMLLLLPPSVVPLLVAAGLVAGRVPDYVRGRRDAGRMIENLGDTWHALGPALVLSIAGAGGPSWSDWPLYLLALGSQFAFDFGASLAREWAASAGPLREQLRGFAYVYGVDSLLAPVGLLAAFAGAGQPLTFLLVLPVAGLFAIFARERGAHIGKAIELSRAYRGTARLLADVLEDASEYTGAHSRDVVSLAVGVSEAMGLGQDARLEVEFTALLHDVGKIAIPQEILDKQGSLSDEEWAVMRTHTIEGQRMLEQVGGALAAIGRAVRASHERWDGKGYPDGLAGEEIPLAARIVAACDAFHAMTSDRPYRAALPQEHAIRELRACAGTQFDPEVGEVLVALVEGSGPEVRPRREPPVAASPERRHAPPGHGARRSFNYSSLVGELEADAEHIAAVAQATRALAQSTDRDAARAAICAAAVRVSGAAAAVLLEPENGRLVETARAGGVAGSPMAQLDFSPDGPLFLPNAWDHPGTPHGFLSDNHGVSAHLQPVTREGARLGLVAVTWEERLERLPEAVAAMMSLLAAEAAVALERTKLLAHLRAAVRTDDLTGLLKRSAWEEELEREVSRARREQRSLCVLMLDLDHFKRLNDTRGHSAGDELLREVATAWRSELRLSDSLARYGGDEFVALLPSCSLADGRRLAERLSSVLPPGQGCSCGLAEWDAGESPAQLVRRADAALLEAKQGGRNQVAVAA